MYDFLRLRSLIKLIFMACITFMSSNLFGDSKLFSVVQASKISVTTTSQSSNAISTLSTKYLRASSVYGEGIYESEGNSKFGIDDMSKVNEEKSSLFADRMRFPSKNNKSNKKNKKKKPKSPPPVEGEVGMKNQKTN